MDYQRRSATCCKITTTKIEKEERKSHESLEDFQRSVAEANADTGNKCIGCHQRPQEVHSTFRNP
jgi:hypothetical protein